MPTIRIPPTLRPDAAGQREVSLSAESVGGAFSALIQSFPGLAPRLLENGDVPAYLNVFVDGEDIRALDGLETKLRPHSTILLLPALAGGADLRPGAEAKQMAVALGTATDALRSASARRPADQQRRGAA